MRVLVVDDEEIIRELLQEFLERRGYSVTCANDGLLGLHTFRRSEPPFDLVISDYRMPRMNGIEMLSTIRELEPDTKMILQSGDPGLGGMMKHAGIGDVPLLHKPYAVGDLFALMERNGIQNRSAS